VNDVAGRTGIWLSGERMTVHTDCIQTYGSPHDPPTYDVVIADNVCKNNRLRGGRQYRGGSPNGRVTALQQRMTRPTSGAANGLLSETGVGAGCWSPRTSS
jgi:hypothetical protein